jgi:intracellular septation protein
MTSNMTTAPTQKPQLNPILKLVFDLGPLLVFYVVYMRFDFFAATAAIMVATLIVLAVTYALTRRLPIMPLVVAIVVMVFGSLTIVLHDETFLKLKLTIIYAMFGSVLLGGLAFGKSLLRVAFDSALHLTEEGWRKLTLRGSLFCFGIAIVNEIVRLTQSTNVWVNFKVLGVAVLTVAFFASQYRLFTKYAAPEAAEPTE